MCKREKNSIKENPISFNMEDGEFKKLDKTIFNQKLDVLALKIPSRKTQEFKYFCKAKLIIESN